MNVDAKIQALLAALAALPAIASTHPASQTDLKGSDLPAAVAAERAVSEPRQAEDGTLLSAGLAFVLYVVTDDAGGFAANDAALGPVLEAAAQRGFRLVRCGQLEAHGWGRDVVLARLTLASTVSPS